MNDITEVVAIDAVVASPATAVAFPLTCTSPEDRLAIGDVITGIGLYADQHEWVRLEASFAPEVTTDYVSLFGGTPQTQGRSALIAAWRGPLPGFDATQHMIVPIEVQRRDPDHAVACSYVRATHRLGTDVWVVGGLYTQELVRQSEGWRVRGMRFSLAYKEGDRSLVARAAARISDNEPTRREVRHGK